MKDEAYEKNYLFEDTHWWFRARNRIVMDAVRRHAPRHGPLRALDYGCGTGKMMELMRGLGDVQGCDTSPAALDYCRRRGHERLTLLNGTDTPPGEFDLITLLDVIEHVDDDRALIARLASHLAPGGRLIITAPALPCLTSGEDFVSEHKRRYAKKSLLAAVRGGGLRPLRATYFNTVLLPPIFLYLKIRAALDPDSLRRSNLGALPAWANALLAAVFGLEAHWLKIAGLPIGMSLLCVAEKPADASPAPFTGAPGHAIFLF